MFSILEVSEGFLLEVPIDKKTFNVSELREKTFKLFVVVVLDTAYLLSHALQFCDLVFRFVLKLRDLTRKITHVEFVKHNHIVFPVFPEQTFEAN